VSAAARRFLRCKESNGDAPIHNPELHRPYEKDDQKEQVIVPDSMVKRARVSQVMAEI
jgi:hypothetical protein